LLNNADYCKEAMTVIYDRKTVYINTEDNADDIWAKQITSKNRNMIRKAEKNELVFKAEYDFASMKKFVELYNGTMKRLEADDFYFFDEAYYEKMEEDFKDHAFLGTVWLGEQLICSAIFFYDGVYGHYHLEGSNHEYSKLAANNFLLWNVAQEMHKLGVKKFHLGGGYDANPENSLLKFKKSFSPNEGDFYIGKWMFNQEVYNQVVADWVAKNPEKDAIYGNRLLKYRY
jgi:lipid II:glycine glycyltransferase (peptidoglycan interpeptide bridge formation enzyme)